MTRKPVALTSKTCSVKNSGAPEIVILFGLARRTARKSRKYHYFTHPGQRADEGEHRLDARLLRLRDLHREHCVLRRAVDRVNESPDDLLRQSADPLGGPEVRAPLAVAAHRRVCARTAVTHNRRHGSAEHSNKQLRGVVETGVAPQQW